MTWRRALTDAQIRATLERHGYPPDTSFGIQYGDVTTVNVEGAYLVVPADVLRMTESDEPAEARRAPLFDHGSVG